MEHGTADDVVSHAARLMTGCTECISTCGRVRGGCPKRGADAIVETVAKTALARLRHQFAQSVALVNPAGEVVGTGERIGLGCVAGCAQAVAVRSQELRVFDVVGIVAGQAGDLRSVS
jgi:hypothetical protein